MCGLVGIVQRNAKPVDMDTLARMLATLHHRGPDEDGYLIQGPVGFGHKRLTIIDKVSGSQPMQFDGVSIVFNGEIYNYVELRNELIQLGHTFRTKSDTEVILRMYLQFGEGCVARLNGMFAFLIYDRREGKVLAARDHLGIKPLYYHLTGDSLIFASEIKALLQCPGVEAEADESALRDYLVFQFVLGAKTLFRNVYKVLPGNYQVIQVSDLSERSVCYWEPRFHIDFARTEKDFLEQLRALIESAAKIQMRSDVALGTYLSGGLDSSIVTMLAAKHSSQPIKTFTGAFAEGPEFDESEYAKEVASACGAQSFVVYPDESEFIDTLPRLIWHMDEPAAGPGVFPQYILARAARKEVKVVLGGQGGDEIFGGYARYVVAYLELALKGAILETNDEDEHVVSLQSILPNLPSINSYLPMLSTFWQRGTFDSMDRRYFQLVDRSGGSQEMFSQDFRADFHAEEAFERFQKIFNHPETKSFYNKMTHFDMVTSLPALLHVEDRVSMAASLESRVPILDHRIVDLVTSMPAPMKFRGAEMKYALKKAIGDILPPRILNRKDKMGFPMPLHLWARGRANAFLRETLLSKECRSRGLFNATAVENLLGQEQPFGRRIWGLLNLELWHRQFIDAAPPTMESDANHATHAWKQRNAELGTEENRSDWPRNRGDADGLHVSLGSD
jgi:asparagine synthase (glutamine-hydrolysing)